jgi:hypothetical protein
MTQRQTRNFVQLLVEDPDLGSGLDPGRLAAARRELVAATHELPVGPWDPGARIKVGPGCMGLFVLSGFIARRVDRGGRYSAELLGPGDVMRPWDGEDPTLLFNVYWNVIQPSRIAVLDLAFATRLVRYPETASVIVARAIRRPRALAVQMALSHHFRLPHRVWLVLWHLAGRWGKVTPQGVLLDIPITHDLLSDLVAAHRPSVTVAFSSLSEAGLVERQDGAWLLHGEPPEDLDEDYTPAVYAEGAPPFS